MPKPQVGLHGGAPGHPEGLAANIPHTPLRVPGSFSFEGDDLTSGWLVWDYEDIERSAIANDATVLQDFCVLAADGAEPEQFVAFAETYGPLMLCSTHGFAPYNAHGDGAKAIALRHLNPSGLLESQALGHASGLHDLFGETGNCRISFREPIARWVDYAQRAAAVIRISHRLRQGDYGRLADWRTLEPTRGPLGMPTAAERLEEGKVKDAASYATSRIEMEMRHWMVLGGLRLHYSWEIDKEPAVTVEGAGVLGMVARQLVFRMGRKQAAGFKFCEACGNPFSPTPELRKYCRPQCQHTGERARKRRYASRHA